MNQNKKTINWSEVNHWRLKFRKTLPDIANLPITTSVVDYLITIIEKSDRKLSILDVGAGSRIVFDKLAAYHDKIIYKSQDIDQARFHDYYDFDKIDQEFDIVTSSEVIEHLDAETKIAFIDNIARVTKKGGLVAIATPNANHPIIFWRDFTHIMPIHYLDLAGILARVGFEDIKVFRLTKMNFKKRLTIFFYKPLLRLLHLDYAQSIMAVGRKN